MLTEQNLQHGEKKNALLWAVCADACPGISCGMRICSKTNPTAAYINIKAMKVILF